MLGFDLIFFFFPLNSGKRARFNEPVNRALTCQFQAAILTSEALLSCLLLTLAAPASVCVKGRTFHYSFACQQAHRCREASVPEPFGLLDRLLTKCCNLLKMSYWNPRKLTHSWFELQWLRLWHVSGHEMNVPCEFWRAQLRLLKESLWSESPLMSAPLCVGWLQLTLRLCGMCSSLF